MCALFPIGSGTKNPIMTRGTIATIGRSHILNSSGIANLLIFGLKEKIAKIMTKINMFMIKLNIERKLLGINGLIAKFNKSKISGPAIR